MKRLGEPLFAHDETGRLKSRIGTVFLRTPGIVTLPGVHATQRIAWIQALNAERQAQGLPDLPQAEVDAEMERSVDLLFDDQYALIRPDPYAMPLAFEADELLQSLISKRKIRYLNTHHEKVRNALQARGENWRMSRLPVSPEEMNHLIANARTSISGMPLYFYNPSTGTRFLTLETFAWLQTRPDDTFRKHLIEIAYYSMRRNRFGYPEIDIFPPGCAFTRQAFEALDAKGLDTPALRAAYHKLLSTFESAVPENLRDETFENLEWRNLLCSTLIVQPNALAAEELLDGISPEFHMQIEWLPGGRIEEGELIFDPVFEETDVFPDDPKLASLCDQRAKSVIFNYLREFGNIEYINVGRITRSLSFRPKTKEHRTNVYIVQVKETGQPTAELRIIRFQKWGISEHLDEGKDLIQSIMETIDYTDYILDRRLGCRQLGMNLPKKTTTSRMPLVYAGTNQRYIGTKCWEVYFERNYVNGYATDKIPPRRYAAPEFYRPFAELLGEAAAVNCIVGRANMENEVIFDDGDEVIVFDSDDRPERLVVSDHTGAFMQYALPLISNARAYAEPVNRRTHFLPDAVDFAERYLAAFQERFEYVQNEYRCRRRAFDKLFKNRPLDPAGSFSFRWQCVLSRLDNTDAAELTETIREQIKVLHR